MYILIQYAKKTMLIFCHQYSMCRTDVVFPMPKMKMSISRWNFFRENTHYHLGHEARSSKFCKSLENKIIRPYHIANYNLYVYGIFLIPQRKTNTKTLIFFQYQCLPSFEGHGNTKSCKSLKNKIYHHQGHKFKRLHLLKPNLLQYTIKNVYMNKQIKTRNVITYYIIVHSTNKIHSYNKLVRSYCK